MNYKLLQQSLNYVACVVNKVVVNEAERFDEATTRIHERPGFFRWPADLSPFSWFNIFTLRYEVHCHLLKSNEEYDLRFGFYITIKLTIIYWIEGNINFISRAQKLFWNT